MDHILKTGAILDDRYRIGRVLGQGGFGITYSAENIRLGLKVAIKELFWQGHSSRDVTISAQVTLPLSSDADVFHAQKERFLREARILRDFSNLSAIVRVLDCFEANNTAYIVMEYVEGVTLLNHLEDHGGRLDAEVLLRRALPLVESLKEVHAYGIIHRDISPDNIMVLPDGALKLIDFGAARAFSHSECYENVESIPASHKSSLASIFRKGRPEWKDRTDDEVIALKMAEAEALENAAYARDGARGYGKKRDGENALYKYIQGSRDIDRTMLVCFLLFFASDGEMPPEHRLSVGRLQDILAQCGYETLDVENDFDWFVMEFLASRHPMDLLMDVVLGYAKQHENSFLYHVYGRAVLHEDELARVMLGKG